MGYGAQRAFARPHGDRVGRILEVSCAGGGRRVGGSGKSRAEVPGGREFTTHVRRRDYLWQRREKVLLPKLKILLVSVALKVLHAYIMSQSGLAPSSRTSLSLRQAFSVSGPVIHQLVKVIGEGALALLSLRGRRSGSTCLCQGGGVVLAVT